MKLKLVNARFSHLHSVYGTEKDKNRTRSHHSDLVYYYSL